LPNYFEQEELINLINSQINRFCETNESFCIAIINLILNPEEDDLPDEDSVNKFFEEIINSSKVLTQSESYTFDGTGYIVLFADRLESYTFTRLKMFKKMIFEKYQDKIAMYAGIAECPSGGMKYNDLIKTAINNLMETKETLQTFSNEDEKTSKSAPILKNPKLFKKIDIYIQKINKYDQYLGEHSANVAKAAISFAKEVGLPASEIEQIAIAGFLHDIGYTIIPSETFNKNGTLTPEERKLVQMHPTLACEHILKGIPEFIECLPLIQNHHEYIDGSGYPGGKRGDQIPLGSQIISIVDTYDAMRTDRPHRKAIPFDKIIDYYVENADIKWDGELITIFSAMVADELTLYSYS